MIPFLYELVLDKTFRPQKGFFISPGYPPFLKIRKWLILLGDIQYVRALYFSYNFLFYNTQSYLLNGRLVLCYQPNNYYHHFPRAFLYCADIAACKFGWESTIFTCCKYGMLT